MKILRAEAKRAKTGMSGRSFGEAWLILSNKKYKTESIPIDFLAAGLLYFTLRKQKNYLF
jgi:hypothetical protein